ncbi:MAG: DUF2852 domain-containing protein [Hyphomicrobiaceae bacterium]
MSEMVARLDDWGRPTWIAAMIAGFIVFWPIGLAILAFLIWSGRMGCGRRNWSGWEQKARDKWERKMQRFAGGMPTSGNRAFDAYREETLKRLYDEQKEFTDFLERLRLAKDKAEFDQFMTDRRNRPAPPAGDVPAQG